jgi:hypothetical protein
MENINESHKLRGWAYVCLAILLALASIPALFGGWLNLIFSAGASQDALLLRGLPSFVFAVFVPIWAIVFGVKGYRILKYPIQPAKKWYQKIWLPVLIALPLIYIIASASYEPPAPSAEVSSANIEQLYPQWYATLATDKKADAKEKFELAYKVLQSRYEKDAPKTPDEYWSYAHCANYLIAEAIKNDPNYSAYASQGLAWNYSAFHQTVENIYTAFWAHADEVAGFNKAMRYSSVIGGTVIGAEQDKPDQKACLQMDIPEKYK